MSSANQRTFFWCEKCDTYAKQAATTRDTIWTCDCDSGVFVFGNALSEREAKSQTPDYWRAETRELYNRD